MAAAVHTILEDLNEKDAEASARQEIEGGKGKAEGTAETAARVSSAVPAAAAPAASNVVHVHVRTVAQPAATEKHALIEQMRENCEQQLEELRSGR